VLGSVATGTLQRAHTPVLLTRPTALERPLPSPQTASGPAPSAAPVTLRLSQDELTLLRQAVESLLLDIHRDEDRSGELRPLLGRLRLAEQTSAPREESAV
jgi:hypothetical protein